jgi:putative ABC transport system permease protein
MILDLFWLAITNLKHRSLRSLLTIVGILIGIAAVVSLISVGQGLQESINQQFEALGSNVLTISAGGSVLSGPPGSSTGAAQITEDDLKVIKSSRGVKDASGYILKMGKVTFNDEIKYSYVIGISQDKVSQQLFQSSGFKIKDGRDLKSGDNDVVVVGYNFGYGNIFSKKAKIRDKILVGDTEFKIIGIADKTGSPTDDSAVYMPIDTARIVFNDSNSFAMIYAQLQDGFTADEVAASVEKNLRKSRNEKEGEEDFTVSTPEQLSQTVESIFGVIQGFLIGIAAISLLVGGVGIMNSMYTSVLERTKEIGIMKAIGARNEHILMLFLFESGMLGLIGGAVGAMLGIAMAEGVQFIAAQAGYGILKASISVELIGGALLFSFVIGALSGALPARRASQMNPVDALRFE